jgi:rod shape-determining protein MreB
MFGFASGIGIDLGTASVLVYVQNKGVILCEPSVVAVEQGTGNILAVGEQARRMIGRTPGNIVAVRPMKAGVIADYSITATMLKYFINRAYSRRSFIKPDIVICVPSGGTSVERRAVLEAAMQAGAKRAYLIEEPIAAAIGAGLSIMEPSGNMVIDIGGGTSDVAVISLGGIVVSASIRVGGDTFDEAIVRYIRKRHNLLIGERTAEEFKIEIGTAYPSEFKRELEVKGRDLVTGLPRTVAITSDETYEALSEPIWDIIDCVKGVLEKTPPELGADIIERGMIMTGGGSLLKGFDKLIQEQTGIPVHMAEDPTLSVALGTGKVLDNLSFLGKNLLVAGRGM